MRTEARKDGGRRREDGRGKAFGLSSFFLSFFHNLRPPPSVLNPSSVLTSVVHFWYFYVSESKVAEAV